MNSELSILNIIKRFHWDIVDKEQRQYYLYWLLSQIPCTFGDMLRARFCASRFKKVGYGLRIQAGTRFRSMENLVVGNNVLIGFDNFIQALGGVTIGNNVLMGPGCKIWSVNHNYRRRNCYVREQGYKQEQVFIGNDVWLAANVFITPGVVLPDGVVVGAGAVLNNKRYKPYAILAGNPARMIGKRE